MLLTVKLTVILLRLTYILKTGTGDPLVTVINNHNHINNQFLDNIYKTQQMKIPSNKN